MEELSNKRVVLFSYGSGLAAAMFSIHVSKETHPNSALATLVNSLQDIPLRLSERREVDPSDFVAILSRREETHHIKNFSPNGSVADLFPGTFYLTHVDNKFRRSYERKPQSIEVAIMNGDSNGKVWEWWQ